MKFRSEVLLLPLFLLGFLTILYLRRQKSDCSPVSVDDTDVDYVLSLSYYDQITSAAMRLASLQCWAGQHGMAVVEPFISSSFLEVPPVRSGMSATTSDKLTFGDIFDVDAWNLHGQKTMGCFSPLVNWGTFIQNAAREVVAVQIIYQRTEAYKAPCTYPRIMKYWSSYLQPNGFRIIERICIDWKQLSWLTEKEFTSRILRKGLTLLIDEWRGIETPHAQILGNRDHIQYIALQHSTCTTRNGRTAVWSSLNPSSKVKSTAEEYIKRHLKGGTGFLAIMLRLEFMLVRSKDYDAIARCPHRIRSLVQLIKNRHHLSDVFLTLDIGTYGSQLMPEHIKIGNQTASNYIESVLSAVYGKPTTLMEYEHSLKEKISLDVHNNKNFSSTAYISTLLKSIASQAACLVAIGGGFYQEHAIEWYYKLNGNGMCIQQHCEC